MELASRGRGSVSPNPMVGSVIVMEDKIIGEGWHREFGKEHAEVNAVNSIHDKRLIEGSTLYVNLEPCCFHGKTPPCTELIISNRIREVVVGCKDQNPKVSGKGIEALEKAGIKVTSGVLESECLDLNQVFFSKFKEGTPYIILKWAQTLDGFIAKEGGIPVKITNPVSDTLVHKMRAEVDGILVGANTIRNDDPLLTTREWVGRSATRIILTCSGDLPSRSKALQDKRTILISENRKVNGRPGYDLSEGGLNGAMIWLNGQGIERILIEGGTKTLESFIQQGLWNECWIFEGEKGIGKGILAPNPPKGKKMTRNVRNNQLFIIENTLSN